MAKSVLITGARAAAALDVARDFAAAGWQVHLADSVKSRMARWSNLRAVHHLYPAPRHNRVAFRAEIERLVGAHQIDLIVPTCEEVFHLSAPDLSRSVSTKLFAPALDQLRELHDKLRFARLAQGCGVSVPESHAIAREGDMEQFAVDSRNWVFKPRLSRFGEQALIGPSPDELRSVRGTLDKGWMAQRRIKGREVCLHAIAHHGRLVGFASYASEWRMGGGACFAFEPLPDADQDGLRAIAEAIVSKAGLHGQFGFDAIFDGDGTAHLIECNPRATSGLHLLTGKGRAANAIAQGQPIGASGSSTAYLGPAMFLFGLPRAVAKRRLGAWWQCLQSGSDVIGAKGDALPVAGAMWDALCFSIKGWRHRISTTAATTHDIEWNGEELA
ncbi:MAG: ATP-grasp domain-containing protein [Pseudomonadota bacterium]|nr:ATP-grasp domain-containing protein [Pseudomonadota bacterium]